MWKVGDEFLAGSEHAKFRILARSTMKRPGSFPEVA
jgi:hypothetical protein